MLSNQLGLLLSHEVLNLLHLGKLLLEEQIVLINLVDAEVNSQVLACYLRLGLLLKLQILKLLLLQRVLLCVLKLSKLKPDQHLILKLLGLLIWVDIALRHVH